MLLNIAISLKDPRQWLHHKQTMMSLNFLPFTIKPETLAKTNPHCKSFDEIKFDELLDIFLEKIVIWVY